MKLRFVVLGVVAIGVVGAIAGASFVGGYAFRDPHFDPYFFAQKVAKRLLAPIIHDSLRIWTGRAGLAGLTAVFVGRFSRRLGVDVRGSSGGTSRVDQGPWAAMQAAIATSALR